MIARPVAVVLCMLLAVLAGAGDVRAAADGPRLPCGVAPVPAYADASAPPNVRAWSGKAAQGWTPPGCVGWPAGDADILVAVAGSFRHDGGMDALLARIGAISAKKGVRYWSVTEKSWQPLVTDAHALEGPAPDKRRADFAPEQFAAGQVLHYAQSDNRSSGKTVFRERVLALDRNRLVIETENVTPVSKMMVTLFEPGDLRTVYVLERLAPGLWCYYSLTRTRMASRLLPIGSEASYINRSVALFRHMAGLPTDLEPPAAR